MRGLDTNVLVRFLVRDDVLQAEQAEAWLRENCGAERPGWISVIVLCELAWVLSRGYRYERAQIADVLTQLMKTVEFVLEDHDLVRSAVRRYREGEADFADCLIGMRNAQSGAGKTITFDRKAAKLREFELLE